MSFTTRTKREVDAHVADVLSKLSSEKERSLRCFGFAKDYIKIREFATARRYLETYISSRPSNVGEAYKLLADVYTEENNPEKALSYYKAAYENGKSGALSHVCDLLRRGVDDGDSEEVKQKWFERQRSTSNTSSTALSKLTYQNPYSNGPVGSSLSILTPRVRSPAVAVPAATVTTNGSFYTNGGGGTGDSYGFKTPPELLSPPNNKTSTPKLNRIFPSPDRVDHEAVAQKKIIEEKLQETLNQNKSTLDLMAQMMEEIKNLRIEVNDLKQNQFNASFSNEAPPPAPAAEPAKPAVQTAVTPASKPAVQSVIVATPPAKPVVEASPAPTALSKPVAQATFTPPSKPAVQTTPAPPSKPVVQATATPPSKPVVQAIATPPSKPTVQASSFHSAGAISGFGATKSTETTPFASFTFKPVGFGDLTANSSTGLFGTPSSSSFTGFEGAGQPLFGFNASTKKPDNAEDSKTSEPNEDEPDDFVPTAEFAPVIPLPPLVEVKKGDEDDDLIYEVRAKLFRFEPATKEWKERGLGNIKIVQNKLNKQQVRVLLWRERVLKLACNHLISRDMVIDFAQKSEKHLTWTAMDYAEPEAKLEKFLCKFGNEAQCSEFKKHFEDMVKFLKSSPVSNPSSPASASSVSPPSKPAEAVTKPADPMTETQPKPLSAIFQKPEGSWDCTDCYSTNKKESMACAACNAPNPSASGAPTTTPETTPFASFNFKPVGFGDLSANTSTGIFGNSANSSFTGFEGAGQPLFGFNASTKKPDNAEDSKTSEPNEDEPDDFVPTAEFAPVIPLPPLVEVKKGDEDDDLIYEVRAKLYRFEPATKEWKERGLGNIKIVQNKLNKQQVRVLLWRERVLKLACNHLISRDMVIDFAQKSEKHLTWTAMDYAEPEAKLEKFLCKFGNEAQCSEFKKHFEDMVKFLKSSPVSNPSSPASASSVSPPSKPAEAVTKPADPMTETQPKPLSAIFQKPEGSWDCTDCYSTNKKESMACAACNAPNPSASGAPTTTPETTPFASFNFKPVGFGDLSANTSTGIFGNSANSSFTGFEGAGQPLFGFNASTKKPDNAEDSKTSEPNEDEPDDFVPTAEFAPVIPLPPLVEVKKGDEDDDLIYEVRAKLYRFEPATKEWKERGLGNIKIVQNKLNKQQVRVLLWRERVLKLACNHLISRDMVIDFAQKSEKHLTWTAMDYAEPEAKLEKFLCKFGNEAQCSEFKKHFENMVTFLKEAGPPSASTSPVTPPVTSTCAVTTPQTSSPQPAIVAEADSPHSPCEGCPGCDSDSFDFAKLDNRELPTYPEQTMTVEEFLQAQQAGMIRD